MKLAPMRMATITTTIPIALRAMIMGVRLPLTGPVLEFTPLSLADIESEAGGVSPG